MSILAHYVIIFWVFIGIVESQSQPPQDAEILLKFKQSLTNTNALNNWNTSISPPCNGANRLWTGVLCSSDSRVWGLQLEHMGLSGTIDIDTLIQLSQLRTISFMNNSFSGPLPSINKLGWLKSLYFSYNKFSGEIHDGAFEGMKQLKKVYLDHNLFSGEVPHSLAALPRLLELSLANNKFNGSVPDFKSKDLKLVNLSSNSFDGQIPPSLSQMNSSSFSGNQGLCGKPLPACPKQEQHSHDNAHSNHHTMAMIIIVTVALLVAITGIFLVIIHRRSRNLNKTRDLERLPPEKSRKKQSTNGSPHDLYPNINHNNNNTRALERPTSYRKSDNGKLCFLRNDRPKFEMQDLLKASAEVLGSGSFGSSYKASIVSGPTFVVKRFKQMNNVGKEVFQEHMKRLGRLRHPNILPLVAFFHKRDEKLIISDFVENGSLASHLHGRHTPDQPGLSWSTRLKIIKGVARGLAYLYRELPQLTIPHGHLKSSNVLLDENFEPLLSDYALAPLINRENAEQVMVAYKCPEITLSNTATKKTDVWCLGILILELLTGQFPANYLMQGRGGNEDLATWVNSVVKEEWSNDMFDVEMKASRSSKGEMLKLLKIGMWCCEWNVEKRWNLREAVEKIEELKEMDNDQDYPSSNYGSGRQLYSTISSISDESVPFRE